MTSRGMRRPKRIELVIACVALLVLAACTGTTSTPTPSGGAAQSPAGSGAQSTAATPTPEPVSLTLGVSTGTFPMMPIWVADAKGYWNDLNLDVDVVVFESGSSLAQAILSKAVQVGAGAFAEAIPLSAQGVPTKVFSTFNTALPFVLIADPEIENVQALAGKTVAISRAGSLTDITLRMIMEKNGLDPSSVKYQSAGNSAPRFAALSSGQVDATLLDGAQAANAIDEGFHQISSLADELPGFPFETLYAQTDYIAANRDAMVRLMMGVIEASTYGTDPANRDEIIQITAEATGLDPKDIGVNYDQTIQYFPPEAPVGVDAAKTALDGFIKYGDVKGIENLTVQDVTDESIQKDALERLGRS